jgi:hypothetical protein
MNAHLKTLLNVSGIAKRNGRLPLVKVGKVLDNRLMSWLSYPLNRPLRPFDIHTPVRNFIHRLRRYAFSLCQQPASMMPL